MGLIATYLTIFLMALHCKNLSHKTSILDNSRLRR
jgi:hypothetical protein